MQRDYDSEGGVKLNQCRHEYDIDFQKPTFHGQYRGTCMLCQFRFYFNPEPFIPKSHRFGTAFHCLLCNQYDIEYEDKTYGYCSRECQDKTCQNLIDEFGKKHKIKKEELIDFYMNLRLKGYFPE